MSSFAAQKENPLTESIMVLCLIFWLFSALGKEPSVLDGLFAGYILEVIEGRENFYDYGELPEPDADAKRRTRKLATALRGRVVPCTQILFSDLIDPDVLLSYYRMLEIAGERLDIIRVMEATPLTDAEVRLLIASEDELSMTVDHMLTPYLLIKSFLLSTRRLQAELAEARTELEGLRQLAEAVCQWMTEWPRWNSRYPGWREN